MSRLLQELEARGVVGLILVDTSIGSSQREPC